MSSVTMANPVTEMMVVRLRPMVSARGPKMKAPSGRPISVVAKIIAEAIPAVAGGISFGMKYPIAGARAMIGRKMS
jgi:hypothetical protein